MASLTIRWSDTWRVEWLLAEWNFVCIDFDKHYTATSHYCLVPSTCHVFSVSEFTSDSTSTPSWTRLHRPPPEALPNHRRTRGLLMGIYQTGYAQGSYSLEGVLAHSTGPREARPRSVAVAQLDSASACKPEPTRFISVNPSMECLYKLPR